MVMTRRTSSRRKLKPDFLIDFLEEDEEGVPRPIKSSIGAGRRSATISKSSGVTEEALLNDDWLASLKRLNTLKRTPIECECPAEFFGIFSIRYSTNGDHFIASFGGGAIQRGKMTHNIDAVFIREHRRGPHVPRKSNFLEEVKREYPNPLKKNYDLNETTRQFWLEKFVRKGNVVVQQRIPYARVVLSHSFRHIYSLRYSTDDDVIVIGSSLGVIEARNSKDGSLLSNIRAESEKKYPVMCVRYHPRYKRFFASGACGRVLTCSLQPGDYNTLLTEKDNEINCFDINQSGLKMATGGKDTIVRIYDTERGKLLQKYPPKVNLNDDDHTNNQHFMRIFASKFHHISDDILITGGWDNYVKIWDIRTPDGLIRNIKGPHICGDAIDIRDDTILTGSWTVSDSLQLWDLPSGRLIDTIKPQNRPKSIDGEYLYCARFLNGDPNNTSNDTVVVGGSGIDAVEIISLLSKKVLGYYKVNKVVQAIDTFNSQIAFGGMDNVLRIGEYTGPEKVEHLEKDSFMHIL